MGVFDFLITNKKKEAGNALTAILPRDIYESGVLELKDIIAPSALKITPKELNLGEKIIRTFFVISYPRFLSESWFAPIINLDKVFDASIFIHPIETARILRQFQKKVAEVQSQIHEREEKGFGDVVGRVHTLERERDSRDRRPEAVITFAETREESRTVNFRIVLRTDEAVFDCPPVHTSHESRFRGERDRGDRSVETRLGV
jgi:hypothetical protein